MLEKIIDEQKAIISEIRLHLNGFDPSSHMAKKDRIELLRNFKKIFRKLDQL